MILCSVFNSEKSALLDECQYFWFRMVMTYKFLYYSEAWDNLQFTRTFKTDIVYQPFIHNLKADSITSNIMVPKISEESLQPFLKIPIFFATLKLFSKLMYLSQIINKISQPTMFHDDNNRIDLLKVTYRKIRFALLVSFFCPSW